MKLLNINEERLMRSDYFAIMVSLITAALIMLPLLLSAENKGNEMEENTSQENHHHGRGRNSRQCRDSRLF